MNKSERPTKIDWFFAKTVLKLVPHSFTPNQMTWIRILSVPILVWFVLTQKYLIALLVFIVSALTDAFDGAMARTRGQITDWGKLLDPIADRLLMLIIGVLLIPPHFGWAIFIIFIALEIFHGYRARIIREKVGFQISANVAGKIKTIFHSFSLGFLFLGMIIESDISILIAGVLLYVGIGFLIWQPFAYPEEMLVEKMGGKLAKKVIRENVD